MKLPSVVIAIALLFAPLHADEAADKDAIVSRAKQMIDSTIKGDMTAVLRFMDPSIVEAIGGKEVLGKAIGGVAEQMKSAGIVFVSMDVQPPERFFQNGQRTFAVVKAKTVMEIPGQRKFNEASSMIAIRDSADGDWTFIRVNQPLASNRELLKRLIPDIPDDLKIEVPPSMQSEAIGK